MQALILAAGYGTRLSRDITNDPNGGYQHLLGVPKPLVPLGGIPLISKWITELERSEIEVSDIFVVSNQRFYHLFVQWAKNFDFPVANIINDGTTCNDDRLGAIRDIKLAFETKKLTSNLIIIGGDTIFFRDFKLNSIIERFRSLNHDEKSDSASQLPVNVILSSPVVDTTKSGIIEVDVNKKVTSLLEKPLPSETSSRLGSPCFYLLHYQSLLLLCDYVANSSSLQEVDAPGVFISWLIKRISTYAEEISGRFDVGALKTYIEADRYFTSLENGNLQSCAMAKE
uniref:Glucose-1-phosphate adenylyltransferase-like n=2 Tax=Hirondellea gigas TaxID=1518452 RepID=A0A6A7G933_9CRUS